MVPVNGGDIDTVWPKVAPLIQQAIHYNSRGEDIEQVRGHCKEGKRQLWVITDAAQVLAAVITQIDDNNGKKIGIIVYAGGEGARHWVHYYESWREYFRERGCTELEVIGRKGWKKLLEKYGLKQRAVIYGEKI